MKYIIIIIVLSLSPFLVTLVVAGTPQPKQLRYTPIKIFMTIKCQDGFQFLIIQTQMSMIAIQVMGENGLPKLCAEREMEAPKG